MVVTEVVVVEGEEQVVTRLVRQTVAVTVTPNAAVPARAYEPVELDISFTSGVPNIDPQTTDEPDGIDLVENLYAGLTNFNHVTNSIEPELALNWEVSSDGRLWTFHLRDDVFWVRPGEKANEDGTWEVEVVRPVAAGDFVRAIQRACQRETGSPDVFILYPVEGCEPVHEQSSNSPEDLNIIGARAPDEFTLEVSLREPAAQFLTITSMWLLHPLPEEALEEPGDAWQSADVLMTSGPFVAMPGSLTSERPVLYRNPLWPIPHKGNVDKINIAVLNDDMQAYQLWQAMQLDIGPLPVSERADFISRTPQKARLISEQTVFYLGFNLASGTLREPEVRRALNAAIDRERLVDELYDGRAMGMRHLVPPGVLAAPPIDEVGKGYDPDYARQQMAQSGFRSCRLMPPITYLASSSDLSLQQAEIIRQMWVEELDCVEDQIIIKQVQFGTLLANTRQDAAAARPDVWELGWASYYPDAQNWLGDLLHCTDSENRSARPCSEVDDLIRQATKATDLNQRQMLYRQIENLFFGSEGSEPIAPLYVPGDYVLVQAWLFYTPALFGGEQFDTYQVDATLKRLEQSR